MRKKIIFWLLAFLITMAAAYYQRKSGPTYPLKISYSLNGKVYDAKFSRSHTSGTPCAIMLENLAENTSAMLVYKRFPSADNWDTLAFTTADGGLKASLPSQPPAGKLAYFVVVSDTQGPRSITGEDPVIIRFKGEVPAGILIPHILLMFLAMFFSNLAGIMSVFKKERAIRMTYITLGLLIIGGMIFGPVMQKFAFGEFWTGVPFGWDLTDNKTLFALIAWVIAAILNRKHFRPGWIIAASLITLIIFSIPHSMWGSELNYETRMVNTGR